MDYQLKTRFQLKVPPAPIKTYFYKRKDGSIFPCEAKEAWAVHNKLQQVGVSDGKAYFNRIKEIASQYNGKIDMSTDEGQALMAQIQKEMQDALNAEIEIARGNLERPPQQNISFLNGDANKLRGLLNG